MKSFSSEFFSANRAKLRELCQNDAPIIITANGVVQRAGDSGFPFRQDSNFWYLTGVDTPSAILVLTSKTELLILPERDPILDYFEGAIDTEVLSKVSGINQIMSNHDGWEQLAQITKKHKRINTCLYKGYDQRHAIYMNPSEPHLISQLKKLAPMAKLSDIRPALTEMRMVKQQCEIEAIQKSVDITVQSFKKVFSSNWYLRNKHEALVSARINFEFEKSGAQNAYPSIVAGGKRACILHYEQNNQPIARDELLLIDAGAEYQMYASDITRVYVPEKMTRRQKNVYKAVKEVQDYAISLIKVGVDIKVLDKKVEKMIGQFLKAEKLITKQEPSQIRRYYPHAISHHLGLDVHDVANYAKPLAEGNVITVEPGIYIPEWNIGVRIEDDVLITKKTPKNLSANLPS